jgi:3-oxoacyl-[acyl-carrier protein] reductase
MTLQGQIALVSGASRGIGQAIALELGKQGATVIGTATSEAGAASISDYLAIAGIKGAGMVLDINDAVQTEQVLLELRRKFGEIMILVNNAGITRDNMLAIMTDAQWDDVLLTNLKSVFRLSRAVLRAMMKARGGRIISIGSVVGSTGNPGQANYAASKAGMLGFTKSLALEVASRNITVNCVAPGLIDTEMTQGLGAGKINKLLDYVPLKRLGHPNDVAAAVAFLAGPGASYITGVTLHVNGGMYMG